MIKLNSTPEEQKQVETMAGYGVPYSQIAVLIRDDNTDLHDPNSITFSVQ